MTDRDQLREALEELYDVDFRILEGVGLLPNGTLSSVGNAATAHLKLLDEIEGMYEKPHPLSKELLDTQKAYNQALDDVKEIIELPFQVKDTD